MRLCTETPERSMVDEVASLRAHVVRVESSLRLEMTAMRRDLLDRMSRERFNLVMAGWVFWVWQLAVILLLINLAL
jgi:hypothetical protein